MPKVLITGNGFDINIGLLTRYPQMMDKFKQLYSNCELGKNTLRQNLESEELDRTNLKGEILIKKVLLSNKFYQFFQNEYDIETWIDFENKIEFLLDKIYEGVTYLNKKYFISGSVSSVSFKGISLDGIERKIDVVKSLLLFGIICRIKPPNKVYRGLSYTVNNKFLIKRDNFFTGFDYKEIAEYLLKELNDFNIIFIEYFRLFVIPEISEKVKGKYDGWFNEIDKHYTFNYTPTFKVLIEGKVKTKYLHGKITEEGDNIVLGVDKLPFKGEYDKHFIPFKKVYQSLYLNTDYSFLSDFHKDSEDHFKFFIIGHSLDMSDAYYLRELINFINGAKSNSRQLFVVYHDDEARSQQLVNMFKIIGENEILKLSKENKLILLKLGCAELINELNVPLRKSESMLGYEKAISIL